MTDLVSRLLEAIGETERIAETAGRDGEPNWTAGGELSETVSTVKYGQPVATGPYGYLVPEVREHIAHNDPSSVLRRCAADRKLLAIHVPVENALGEQVCECCATQDIAGDREGEWPCETVMTRVEAYGLEVSE